jgi:hypothetical protein
MDWSLVAVLVAVSLVNICQAVRRTTMDVQLVSIDYKNGILHAARICSLLLNA